MIFIHTAGYCNVTRLRITADCAQCTCLFHLTDFCERNLFFFSVFIRIRKSHILNIRKFCIRLLLGLYIDFVIFDVCGDCRYRLAVCHLGADKLIYLCYGKSVFCCLFLVYRDGKLRLGIFHAVIDIRRSFRIFHDIGNFTCQLLQSFNIISLDTHRQTASKITAVIHGRSIGRYLTVEILGLFCDGICDIGNFHIRILIKKNVHAHTVVSATHKGRRRISSCHGTNGINALDI